MRRAAFHLVCQAWLSQITAKLNSVDLTARRHYAFCFLNGFRGPSSFMLVTEEVTHVFCVIKIGPIATA